MLHGAGIPTYLGHVMSKCTWIYQQHGYTWSIRLSWSTLRAMTSLVKPMAMVQRHTMAVVVNHNSNQLVAVTWLLNQSLLYVGRQVNRFTHTCMRNMRINMCIWLYAYMDVGHIYTSISMSIPIQVTHISNVMTPSCRVKHHSWAFAVQWHAAGDPSLLNMAI